MGRLIKLKESDLCLLLESPSCGISYGQSLSVFWESHPAQADPPALVSPSAVSKMLFLILCSAPSLH